MKRQLLTLAAVCLMGLSAFAQTPGIQKIANAVSSSAEMPAIKMPGQHRTPKAAADLASNQRILGHYDSDNCEAAMGGLGLTNFPGVNPAAVIFDEDELSSFKKGKIVSMRIALASATPISRIFIAETTDDGGIGDYVYEQTVSGGSTGWNTFTLDTPYEIADDATTLVVGFDYKQTSTNYPICAVEEGDSYYPTYFWLSYNGVKAWYSIGLENYGSLALQCIVESDYYPEQKVVLSNLQRTYYVNKSNGNLSFEFDAKNFGTKDISEGSYVFDYAIDGEKAGSIVPAVGLTATNQTFDGEANVEALSTGKHSISIWASTPEGTALEGNTLTDSFCVYSGSMTRQKHLVEQFTSTYCTYCPVGTQLLQTLAGMRSDIAWVGVHGNMNGTDIYKTAQCDTLMGYLGVSSYPSAAFDRVPGLVDDGIPMGVGYYAQYHEQIASSLSEAMDYIAEQMPTFASIDISSSYDASTLKANITVSGELCEGFSELFGDDATLTVYLTEDSLVSKQLNQGTWVNDYTHNGVLRKAVNSVFGQAINADGTTYKNTFSVTLDSSWKPENMNVIAFISRPLAGGDTDDMYLNNAELAKLGETVTGISNVAPASSTIVRYYDLNGIELSQPRKGLNIVRDANGTRVEMR